MATINISDLRPTGSEGYLNELGDGEFDAINGGLFPIAIWGIPVATKYVVGAMAGGAIVGGVTAIRER